MQLAPVVSAPALTVALHTVATSLIGPRPEKWMAYGEAPPTTVEPDLSKYYALAQGKQGVELLTALGTITKTGHVDRGYSAARDELFSEVDDVDGDNQVPDVFTGQMRGPITGKGDGFSKGMNTEHTWAQSKGATGIAQADLHHLRASDIDTNSKRGSFPYGDVATSEWSTGEGVHQARLGTDSLGWTVMEPAAEFKGDIARGLLYFYTRYETSRPGKYTNKDFQHELPTLLKWAKADPVTPDEVKRNDLIQKFQGNRNPFVDHPEYLDAINFSKIVIK